MCGRYLLCRTTWATNTAQRSSRPPTHIELPGQHFGLTRDSVVLMEQIRTIDKRRLRERMGTLDESHMQQVNQALAVSFGLGNQTPAGR